MLHVAGADVISCYESIEKRWSECLPGLEGAIAAFIAPGSLSSYTRFAQIVDIGKRGLVFEHARGCNGETLSSFLDIIGLVPPHPHIESIPFRVVYDREIISTNENVVRMNLCGLEFIELSTMQISQLSSLIEYYSTRGSTNIHTSNLHSGWW